MAGGIYVFDIEANGLIPDQVEDIHCCHLQRVDVPGEPILRFDRHDGIDQIPEAVKILNEADLIVGHNILRYDLPVLHCNYPWFNPKGTFDTLIGGKLCRPDTWDKDMVLVKAGRLPKDLAGKHSLRAWGYRLGEYKGDYEGPWETWCQEMSDYCVQDVAVTAKLYAWIMAQGFSAKSHDIEQQVARIIVRQETFGVCFDEKAAAKLYAEIAARKLELLNELREVFPPDVHRTTFIPRANNSRYGYTKGVPVEKVTVTEFNPGSRKMVAYRLKRLYKWEPVEFTPSGEPKIDDEVLSSLPWPEAKKLAAYFLIVKRLGQIADGENGWLKMIGPDGRIHGRVDTIGANTGRMAHSRPNLAQVPAVRSEYGHECRALFGPPKGMVQVGVDASGLELRTLAHYMARFDHGAYADIVCHGDPHSVNQEAAGLPTRDAAKTFIYAFIKSLMPCPVMHR